MIVTTSNRHSASPDFPGHCSNRGSIDRVIGPDLSSSGDGPPHAFEVTGSSEALDIRGRQDEEPRSLEYNEDLVDSHRHPAP